TVAVTTTSCESVGTGEGAWLVCATAGAAMRSSARTDSAVLLKLFLLLVPNPSEQQDNEHGRNEDRPPARDAEPREHRWSEPRDERENGRRPDQAGEAVQQAELHRRHAGVGAGGRERDAETGGETESNDREGLVLTDAPRQPRAAFGDGRESIDEL